MAHTGIDVLVKDGFLDKIWKDFISLFVFVPYENLIFFLIDQFLKGHHSFQGLDWLIFKTYSSVYESK